MILPASTIGLGRLLQGLDWGTSMQDEIYVNCRGLLDHGMAVNMDFKI